MKHIRIISDLHGDLDMYRHLIRDVKYSVQLGDMGFAWGENNFHEQMAAIDSNRHVVILGNHDDYDNQIANLGDFGVHSFPINGGEFEFFYIRGAYSIDQYRRTVGIDWWANEELTWEEGQKAFEKFEEVKPEVVLTHECPAEIVLAINNTYKPSLTSQILQACFNVHQPKIWIFGHHHVDFRKQYNGTTFIGLDGELGGHHAGYVDFDWDGKLIKD